MSLNVKKIYRVSCPICDWMQNYNNEEDIPDGCPRCGGDEKVFMVLWETRKEKIHAGLKKDELKWE